MNALSKSHSNPPVEFENILSAQLIFWPEGGAIGKVRETPKRGYPHWNINIYSKFHRKVQPSVFSNFYNKLTN